MFEESPQLSTSGSARYVVRKNCMAESATTEGLLVPLLFTTTRRTAPEARRFIRMLAALIAAIVVLVTKDDYIHFQVMCNFRKPSQARGVRGKANNVLFGAFKCRSLFND